MTAHVASRAAVFGLLFAGALSGCHHDKPGGHGGSHWSYAGPTGPEHWGTLSPDYALCSTGRSQSPVDIAATLSKDLPNIAFSYRPSPVEILNNGHTVQVNYAAGSVIHVNGVEYELKQFHFHAPSEHTVRGRHAAAEMHLVHSTSDGRLAVVGVLLEEGAHNANFDPVWHHLPASESGAVRTSDTVLASNLLPTDQRTFRYSGSPTTPPGTEGVSWFLMVEPVRLSHEQLAAFTQIYTGNNRPVQAMNGRSVEEDSSR